MSAEKDEPRLGPQPTRAAHRIHSPLAENIGSGREDRLLDTLGIYLGENHGESFFARISAEELAKFCAKFGEAPPPTGAGDSEGR
jgi:hypothetical protein